VTIRILRVEQKASFDFTSALTFIACPGQYAAVSLAAYPPAKRNSFSEAKRAAAARGHSGGWLE